jgi:hypothetical protein
MVVVVVVVVLCSGAVDNGSTSSHGERSGTSRGGGTMASGKKQTFTAWHQNKCV